MAIKKRKVNLQENTTSDKVYSFIARIILGIVMLSMIYPMWTVVVCSFSDPYDLYNQVFHLWPLHFRTHSYALVFENEHFMTGLGNSIFYTVAGTAINIILTVMCAYPLSRKNLAGRKFIMIMITITMYFGGGMIPTYLLVSSLHMVDTIWAMLIPGAISTYNVIIMRTYFMTSIPGDLEDAALVDGSTNFHFLMKIVLPLSAPILVVIALYYGVGHWNAFFNAMIYLNDMKKWPMQLVLREILLQNDLSSTDFVQDDPNAEQRIKDVMGMKYAFIVVATIPMFIIYPLCQRFFAKGVMVGSLKG